MMNFDYKNYDMKRHYAIEASAGTGKTFNINEIVKKLVSENISLDKILIVTYTEKATGELKDRIRRELSKAFKGKEFDFENAPIYTIHSFCKTIIDEYSVIINSPMSLSVIDESEVGRFIDEYIRDDDFALEELKKFDYTLSKKVKEKLVKALNKYYLNKSFKEDKDVILLDKTSLQYEQYLCKDYNDFLSKFSNVAGAISAIEENLDTFGVKKNEQERRARLESFIKVCRESLDNISYSNKFFYNGNTYQVNKNDCDAIKDAFGIILDFKNNNSKVNNDALVAIKLLPDLYKKWSLYKERIKAQTFNDMIRIVREEIKNPNSKLLDALKAKYSYGIIDEFQDTNELQWDIFSSIFLNDDSHHLIVVGDPKQSIYSFQGADVDVYQKAVKSIEDLGYPRLSLSNNFRSTSAMIDACNKIFKYEADGKNFFLDNNIKFFDSGCGKKGLKGTFDGKTLKPVWIMDEATESTFAEAAVQKIIECIEVKNGKTRLRITVEEKTKNDNGEENTVLVERNVKFSDFAVLSRSRSERFAIERMLKKYGVPFVKNKDNGLFKGSLECASWHALLDAICTNEITGKNIHYFKKALFTKFFNKTLEEIDSESYNSDKTNEIILIYKWKKLASERKWEDLIDSILIESNLQDAMADSTMLDSYGKFKQIGDFLIQYLTKNHSLEEAVDFLYAKMNSVATDDEIEDGIDIITKSTDFDCVKLMTIHASKGLEFPVVISPAGFKGPKSDSIYTSLKNENKYLFLNSDIDTQKYASEKRKQEWMRLFYVDYTRASYLLITPIYSDVNDANIWLKNALVSFKENASENLFMIIEKDSDVSKYKEIVKDTLKELSKGIDLRRESTKEQDERLTRTDTNVKKACIYKKSYSSLAHGSEDETITDSANPDKEGEVLETKEKYDSKSIKIELKYDKDKTNEISIDYPKGNIIGNALHEVFEKYDFTNTSDDDLRKLIIERFTASGITLKNEWISDTIKIVRNVLSAILLDPKTKDEFKLDTITEENKLAEVEFNFNIFKEKLKDYFIGFIDLVFKRGDKYYIIDWKSDSLNDSDFKSYAEYDELKNHVDKCYAIQRTLYSYVLIKWISESLDISSKEEVFSKYFGGIYYMFIKGAVSDTPNGIYAHTWESYADLEASYKEIISKNFKGGINDL